jgi:hypothetical protein
MRSVPLHTQLRVMIGSVKPVFIATQHIAPNPSLEWQSFGSEGEGAAQSYF